MQMEGRKLFFKTVESLSYCNFFGLLKQNVGICKFCNYEEVETAVCEGLRMPEPNCYHSGMLIPVTRQDECISVLRDYAGK